MPHSTASAVARTIRRRGLLSGSARVIVALSGGADSVALAWLLREIEPRASWRLAGFVHVHHGLRGADADADEAFCRALADRMQLPIHVAHADVAALARRARTSIEAAGRAARDAAFADALERLPGTDVATAHTMDDQAETVLLRLFRGATQRGVSGIRPRRGRIVRPLIDCRRDDVRAYLRARGEPHREDRSNEDRSVPRNRLRHDVLPVIAAHWPGAIPAMARFADLAAADERALAEIARQTPAIECGPDGVQVNGAELESLPDAIARRVLRDAVETAGRPATSAHLDAMLRLLRSDTPSGELHLSRLTIERRGRRLRLTQPRGRAGATQGFEARPLDVPGTVHIGETGTTLEASFQRELPPTGLSATLLDGTATAVLQAATLTLPLMVRPRRPGDRFQPLGAPGRRRVQDVLVDRKVPRDQRDRVPVVVDADERIVWVAGIAQCEASRVTSPEGGVVILKMSKGTQ